MSRQSRNSAAHTTGPMCAAPTHWACVRQRQACLETMLCARARQGAGRALVRALLSPIATELSSSLVHCVVHCLSHCSLTLFMCIVHRHFTHGVSESGFESNGTRNIWKKKIRPSGISVSHITSFFLQKTYMIE